MRQADEVMSRFLCSAESLFSLRHVSPACSVLNTFVYDPLVEWAQVGGSQGQIQKVSHMSRALCFVALQKGPFIYFFRK